MKRRRYRPSALSVLILYYWALIYLIPPDPFQEGLSGFTYDATVWPALAWLIVTLGLEGMAFLRRPARPPIPVLLIGAFVVLAFVIALLHDEWPFIAEILFPLMLGVCLLRKERVPLTFLNWLFLASIVAGELAFLFGRSLFGILYWQSDDALSRASLFPSLSDSAMFSALVVLLNIAERRSWRWCLAIGSVGGYFVFFSGNRTGMLAAAVGVLVLLASRIAAPRLVAVAAYATVTAAVLLPGIIRESYPDSFLAQNYLLREERGEANIDTRAAIWTDHWNAFAESPAIGLGRNEMTAIVESLDAAGTESFLTRILAQFGIVAFLFWAALLVLVWTTPHDPPKFILAVILPIALGLYGSWAVPYSFLAFVMGSRLMAPPPARPHWPHRNRATPRRLAEP